MKPKAYLGWSDGHINMCRKKEGQTNHQHIIWQKWEQKNRNRRRKQCKRSYADALSFKEILAHTHPQTHTHTVNITTFTQKQKMSDYVYWETEKTNNVAVIIIIRISCWNTGWACVHTRQTFITFPLLSTRLEITYGTQETLKYIVILRSPY